MLENIIVIAIIALLIGAAIAYMVKKKKSGGKCIGCPYAKECTSRKADSGCNCGNDK